MNFLNLYGIIRVAILSKLTYRRWKMAREFKLKHKKVTIHSDGQIFVEGKSTGLKMWKSSSTRYSNHQGTEQKDVKGKELEAALILRGFLPRWFSPFTLPSSFSQKKSQLSGVGTFAFKTLPYFSQI